MWKHSPNALYQLFTFNNFSEAFAFISKVALLAEQNNHHPTIKNTYNKVEIWLSTHDAGNSVTQKDIQMASAIDTL
ncbi:MAG: 4a-hydroxytetrahydrobiopterin dehydratase [Sphingobacteriales bacterium]|nr:MAG: 4a-hydroxytetrahydrobiopterin dehydratase [Sphingobacteriales bacterium]TAF82320.1 MAG: 4a-hydroxytetrahydrobiopterin dehydratase [Sphingobacteriales bacterium]